MKRIDRIQSSKLTVENYHRFARGYLERPWENDKAEKEFPFWLRYERGSALLKAAKTLKMGYRPWQSDYVRDYFNAGGNEAAMRILPHVIASSEKSDIKELMLEVAKDTRITQGHPRAFLGAACYAYVLDYLLKKDCVLEYGELVETVLGGQNGWGAPLDSRVFGDWINTARQRMILEQYAREKGFINPHFCTTTVSPGLTSTTPDGTKSSG